MDALGNVLADSSSGWAGWAQATSDKVITALLPTAPAPAQTVGAASTSGALISGTGSAGVPATIAGVKVTTLAIAGAVLLAAFFAFGRR